MSGKLANLTKIKNFLKDFRPKCRRFQIMSMDTSATLLQSLQSPDQSESWAILNELYGPMIRRWLSRNNVRIDEHDDVVQEVLIRVAQKVAQFQHSGRTGAFRNWLKQITINCLRNYQRKVANRQHPVGGSDFEAFLNQWADPESPVSRVWRSEYREGVMGFLLHRVQKKFKPNVFQAFYQTAILDRPVSEVSDELEMSSAAIYTARSRIMKEIRSLKEGIDDDE